MNSKKTAGYSHVFSRIHMEVLPLECVAVVTDYERALRNALAVVIGTDAEYIGCWFHYTQAVRKNAMQAGLGKKFTKNKELMSLYGRLLCLPLLPADQIVGVFHQLYFKLLYCICVYCSMLLCHIYTL